MMTEDPAAEAYLADLADRTGTRPLRSAEIDAVLRLTKVVAHTSERRFAPLTAYAAALALADRDEHERLTFLESLLDAVRSAEG